MIHPRWRLPHWLGLTALLAGCATGQPVVTSFQNSMVTIEQPKSTRKVEATALAKSTCNSHASLLSDICIDSACKMERLIYWCR